MTGIVTLRPPVARFSELAENSITRKRLADELEVILVRSDGEVHAFGATCPHAGAPLDEGAVCDGRLICPWHKAEFRIRDGALLQPPALDDLISYPVEREGEDVFVSNQPITRPPSPRHAGRETVAIIGSGAAGIAGAAELRRLGFDGRILLIGAEAETPYDRTALSKFVISGAMKPDEIPPLREPDWFAQTRIERISATVTRVDASAKAVHLGDGRIISYDKALVALGSVAKRPALPGMTLRGAATLHNRADAPAILAAPADSRVVIMGSSFIGLEAASALRDKGCHVTVVAPDTVPFAKQLGPEIGGMFRRLHEAHGVIFRLQAEIDSIDGTGSVTAVTLKGGETLPAEFVLVGVGVAPASETMHGVEKAADGGIVVDGTFRAADGLYAAGDCAAFPLHGRPTRIEHWRVAQQQARIAASAMMGGRETYSDIPFFWTYHYGKRFEYLGHAAVWDSLQCDGDLDSHNFVALQIKDGNVVGVIACQRERVTAILMARLRHPLAEAEALALIRAP
jgi:NADPH-dependent 2,4-dienoyl-CoA reductase/sulfur reductase-like enzyme/nitrite reductase/ring-hydroxylating ferredoxin subunit